MPNNLVYLAIFDFVNNRKFSRNVQLVLQSDTIIFAVYANALLAMYVYHAGMKDQDEY